MPSLISFLNDCYSYSMERRRIPNRLKKYRRLAGLSQKEVAQFLGLKNTACISRWEKGCGYPGITVLFRLSLLYKTLPNHLYQEVWESLKEDIQQNLLTREGSFMSNETYLV